MDDGRYPGRSFFCGNGRSALRLLPSSLLSATVAMGCGGSSDAGTPAQGGCTLELRVAVLVAISNPSQLPIDSVTATNQGEQPCERDPVQAEDTAASFRCYEQGAGTYTVRVTSGSNTWTSTTTLAADACHVTEQKSLSFVLDPAHAD